MAEDIGVDAVKIGMLGTAEIVAAVDAALDLLEPGTPVVIDPVMVAESGAVLLDDARPRARSIELLLPRATVITPNLPEARVLAGGGAPDDVEALARALHALGPDVVVVTGGHREEATDVLFDGDEHPPDPGRAPPRRRRARLGLHALLGARRPPRARPHAARGGPRGARDRRRGGARRAARARPRARGRSTSWA